MRKTIVQMLFINFAQTPDDSNALVLQSTQFPSWQPRSRFLAENSFRWENKCAVTKNNNNLSRKAENVRSRSGIGIASINDYAASANYRFDSLVISAKCRHFPASP